MAIVSAEQSRPEVRPVRWRKGDLAVLHPDLRISGDIHENPISETSVGKLLFQVRNETVANVDKVMNYSRYMMVSAVTPPSEGE